MRWIRRLIALVGAIIVLATAAAATVLYLAATGEHVESLKALAGRVGTLLAGQQMDSLALEVQVRPDEGELSAQARATVHVREDGRRRLYFLLNDALRLRSVRVEGHPNARAYHLWLLVVVDVGGPLKADDSVAVTLEYDGNPTAGLLRLGPGTITAREVILGNDAFWFPVDLQGQFKATVAVTLPADLTLVHAGDEQDRSRRGSLQRVQWTYARPIPGMSLVAGPYHVTEHSRGEVTYRLFVADDIALDEDRVFQHLADAGRILAAHYGPSGYPTQALFVTRHLRRGYNDGAGVIGLSIRYFRHGDYGFGFIAHEIAHDWWGATVMERWLTPGTGGEWLVEGWAEFSSLVAAEERFGRAALVHRLALESFDPRCAGTVSDMSVIDNAVTEDVARNTIYHKGSYVAMMLRRTLGDDKLFEGVRTFIDRHRYQSATDRDLEAVLGEVSGVDLSPFFNEWVRSPHSVDLRLDAAESGGGAVVHNAGPNSAIGEADVWVFASPEAEPQRRAVHVGDRVDLSGDGAFAVVDPELTWADMDRQNNRFPAQPAPLVTAVSRGGARATVFSDPFPWAAGSLRLTPAAAGAPQTWDLATTVSAAPVWLDENRLLLSLSDCGKDAPDIAVFDTHAERPLRVIGRGAQPTVAADTVYAARGERLLRFSGPRWREETIARVPQHRIELPVPSPDSAWLAYAVSRANDLELRVRRIGGGDDRMLFAWDRDLVAMHWSADATRLFVALGGDWDWQIWEVPIDGGPIRTLVREAASITSLAVAPSADRIAFTAAPALDYPANRQQVFVVDVASSEVKPFDLPNADARQVVWVDDDTLLAVVAAISDAVPWHLPERRALARIRVSDGTIERVE